MNTADILKDAYGRIRELVHASVEGLGAEQLAHRIEADSNSIAWLAWHLTRVQDHHLAELAGREQAWIDEGWAERFGMPPDPDNTGYGHTSAQVAAVRPHGPDVLAGYHDVVSDRTIDYLQTVDVDELGRIIDHSYTPPVTVGVRLVSVVSDNLQHAGQAQYVRGIVDRMAGSS